VYPLSTPSIIRVDFRDTCRPCHRFSERWALLLTNICREPHVNFGLSTTRTQLRSRFCLDMAGLLKTQPRSRSCLDMAILLLSLREINHCVCERDVHDIGQDSCMHSACNTEFWMPCGNHALACTVLVVLSR
jgi:hypothetical protein